MEHRVLLTPLDDFAQLIAGYFQEIWGFLMFIGTAASIVVILVGAIMFLVGIKVGKTTGRGLILGGIILAIVIAYFTMYPPNFDFG
ncbi:MAG: hypothetical protein ACFFBJ_04325 [Promethearchaeota archaeon]